MYCTTVQLADARLARELAQVATPDRYTIVADDLMDASLRGSDRSSFDPADVAIADQAMAIIDEALTSADSVIDGYLAMRKPTAYTLPLSPVPGIVTVWARQIARYLLHKDRIGTDDKSDPIVRDYRDALSFLGLVRDGKFALGVDDPLPAPSAGAPQSAGPDRVFDSDTLADYGA